MKQAFEKAIYDDPDPKYEAWFWKDNLILGFGRDERK